MASPLPARKQAVNLASSPVPGSRIRRDPPPVAKQAVVPDRDESDKRAATIGILVFTLAIVAIIIGISSYGGCTPRDVTVRY